MKTLLSYTIKNQKQSEVIVLLSDILKEISEETTHLEPTTSITDNFQNRTFDVIVAYTDLGLQQILPIAKQQKTPIVYVVDSDEIETAYTHISYVNKVVLIGNTKTIPIEIIRKDLFEVIPMWVFPQKEIDTPQKETSKKEKQLLIDIRKYNLQHPLIYKLIPLCNLMVKLKVTILYEEKPLLPLLNNNIKMLDRNKVSVEDMIVQSDIVVANGDTVLKSVLLGKPCVVVGEQGYGGVITPQNLKIFYQNDFQGRIGGYLNEYIPEHLLQNDIQKLTSLEDEKQKEFTKENKKIFLEIYKEFSKKWANILSEVIEQEKSTKDLINCSLKLSSDFSLLPFPDDKFVLSYKETRQVHSNFGKEEATIILLFKEPVKVKEALEKSDYKDEKTMFLEFVQMLVNEKILMPYGN